MPASPKKTKLLVVTVVWGDWHIGTYFDLNLPTLLAERNFPALIGHCDITYLFYTSQADMRRLREAPQMRSLGRLAKLEFRRIPDVAMKDPMAAHHAIWNEAADLARGSGAFILLMPPDVAWSNGSFAHAGKLLAAGKQAIFMTYLRVESESFARAFQQSPRSGDGSISLNGAQMVDLGLATAHPLMPAYVRDSTHFPIHPEMIFWPVPGEGLSCRMLAREMFIYHPAILKVNTLNLLDTVLDPSSIHVIDDSDDLFGVSLTPLEKEIDWYRAPRIADPAYIGEWWLEYDSWINDIVAGTKLRWHVAPVTESAWQARERASDLFVWRAAAFREGRRLFAAARQLRCNTAACLLALAVQSGLMPRVARGRGGALVFLPSDKALAEKGPEFLERLLEAGGERELARLIRAHYIPGDTSSHALPIKRHAGEKGESRLRAANGSELTIAKDGNGWGVNGARVVAGPERSGLKVVYAIDRVLAS